MKKWNQLAQQHIYLRRRGVLILTVLFFLMVLIIVPILLSIPFVRSIVTYCLSFTDDPEYKIAYVELWGVIIGSFMAIYGALWTQRKIDQEAEASAQRKFARIVYYDLHFAFQDLLKLVRDTAYIDKANFTSPDKTTRMEAIRLFAARALTSRLYLNSDWIRDVAELGDYLSPEIIDTIYKWYGTLSDIDRAMQSGNPKDIESIFVPKICQLISVQDLRVLNRVQEILNEVRRLTLEVEIKVIDNTSDTKQKKTADKL